MCIYFAIQTGNAFKYVVITFFPWDQKMHHLFSSMIKKPDYATHIHTCSFNLKSTLFNYAMILRWNAKAIVKKCKLNKYPFLFFLKKISKKSGPQIHTHFAFGPLLMIIIIMSLCNYFWHISQCHGLDFLSNFGKKKQNFPSLFAMDWGKNVRIG